MGCPASGRTFYYENEPSPLEQRRELSDSGGSITSSDIARFIADGRKDAVKAAITFIIEQYRLPPESRKYLVIRDESSGFLELWIAAIESAFRREWHQDCRLPLAWINL